MSDPERPPEVSVKVLCDKVHRSKQAFYQQRHERAAQTVDEATIVALVQAERQRQPRLGARKLLVRLEDELTTRGISIGRDRFLGVLKRHELLVPKPTRRCRTTDSAHPFRVWPDLLKERPAATAPNEVWVADLTYIDTREGFMYLALITDAYSRKIVGWDLADTLEAEGCLRALRQAQAQLPAGQVVIHHSDRGIQYCCKAYIAQLQERGTAISMTRDGNCYDNALAERMNGILKTEYLLNGQLPSKQVAAVACPQAIMLYNTARPHYALKMKTPAAVHGRVA